MKEDKKANPDYPVMPEIANRWSPRAFADKRVDEETLKSILEAARWAPSSQNEQPWRFIIAQRGEEHYDKLFEGLDEWNRGWAWTAPVLGFTVAAKNLAGNGKTNRTAVHDVGLAMGNFLAQATYHGLFVHQMAGIGTTRLAKNFGINTDEYQVVAAFAIGYPDIERLKEIDEAYEKSEKAKRKRKPLKELVFGASFGENPGWL